MGAGPVDAGRALEELESGVTRLADVLVQLETSPELALVRDASQLRGRSAELAAEAVAAATTLWSRYPTLTDAVEALASAVDDGDRARSAALLGPNGVELADGSTCSIRHLLTTLERDAAAATASINEVATAWRDVLPRLDAVAREATDLAAAASELGLVDEPDLRAARRLVAHLTETVAADPLGVDPAPAERAIARARARVDELEQARDGLPDGLANAVATLQALSDLVDQGSTALERARSRILSPDGLLTPLDRSVLDGDGRSLRPWLRRLEEVAADGDWRAASAGLERWRAVADGWLANARRVVDANRAPVARRDDLRGLLDAYRVKVAALGRAEDEDLGAAFREAHGALQARPCDLAAAERLVAVYVDLLNKHPGAEG